MTKHETIAAARIKSSICLVRGHRAMLDADLAALYGVTTGNLNKAVKRNHDRFPADFMFTLTKDEYRALRFQSGTLEKGRYSKYLPHVFTEQGVAMLSSVLRSKRAIQVNVAIMRAFVKLRETLSAHKELARKLAELESKIEKHDKGIRTLFEAIRQLTSTSEGPSKRIGFHVKERRVSYGGAGRRRRK